MPPKPKPGGGGKSGDTLTSTITYPQTLPPGAAYWKYGSTPSDHNHHWYPLPAVIAGNTATFTITDGDLGDDDLTPNSIIVDQGGAGNGRVGIPVMSRWAILLLSLLLAGFGLRARLPGFGRRLR